MCLIAYIDCECVASDLAESLALDVEMRERVSLAYTVDSYWRNRSEFLNGRFEIVAFLTRKWARELNYRLIK